MIWNFVGVFFSICLTSLQNFIIFGVHLIPQTTQTVFFHCFSKSFRGLHVVLRKSSRGMISDCCETSWTPSFKYKNAMLLSNYEFWAYVLLQHCAPSLNKDCFIELQLSSNGFNFLRVSWISFQRVETSLGLGQSPIVFCQGFDQVWVKSWLWSKMTLKWLVWVWNWELVIFCVSTTISTIWLT